MDRSFARRLDRTVRPTVAGWNAGVVLTLLLVLAFTPSILRAEFSQVLVNREPDGETDRFDPGISRLENGRYLLVWADLSRGSEDIYSCLLGPDLGRLTPPAPVNTDGTYGFHQEPILSTAGGARLAALWINDHGDFSDLVARVYSDSTGAAVSSDLKVNNGQQFGRILSPSAATNGQGTTLVCWMDNRVNQYRILAQRLDRGGFHLGGNYPLVPEHPQQVQYDPALATRPGGGWVLAWDEPEGSGFRVYFRFISPDGATEGGLFGPSGSGIDQKRPALLIREQDMLLVWVDNRDRQSDLWGQWFNLLGAPLGDASRMQAVTTTGEEATPSLMANPDGGYALLWSGFVDDRERAMIRGFSQDGSPLGPERPMRDPPDGVHMGKAVAAPADRGRLAVAWNDDWTRNEQVYIDLADPATGPRGQAQPVYSLLQSAHQILPDVAMLPGGKSVVVWGDARAENYVIYAQIIEASGDPDTTAPIRVSQLPTNVKYLRESTPEDLRAYAPHVAASGIGSFVVTWAADVGGGKLGAYGQLFDSEAHTIGENFEIPRAASGPLRSPQYDPTPAMGSDGRFAIVWRDDSIERDGDIYLQRYRATGDTVGHPILVNNPNSRESPQQNPDIAMSPFYEMVVTWIDRREGGWDIVRQRIGPTGNRLDTADDVQVNPPDSPSENQFYPAVAANGNAIVEVWDDVPLTQGFVRGRLDFLESAAVSPGVGAASSTRSGKAAPVEFTVNPFNHPPGVKRPRVAMDSSGRFVVTWWDLSGGFTHVWAQRYNADGTGDGSPYLITEHESEGHRLLSRVAANGSRIQYVWIDSRRSQGWDVYARRVNWFYDGQTTPVELSTMSASATAGGIVLDWKVPLGQGNPLFRVWRELADGTGRGGNPSPEAVLLTPDPLRPLEDGTYRYLDASAPASTPLAYFLERLAWGGGSEFFGPVQAELDPPSAARWLAQPNPFVEQVQFQGWETGGAVRLTVWDIAGRRLRVLQRAAGSSEPLLWDGRDAAGRHVPAGLYLVRPESNGPNGSGSTGRRDQDGILRVLRVH